MNPLLRLSLDRTFLLMRDELCDNVTEHLMLDALMRTEVVLAADVENLSSHAAQCAFITAALLMARSGHRVYLAAPDVPIVGQQPPLKPGTLVASLMDIGRDLLPGVEFSINAPAHSVDLCVVFGNSQANGAARHVIGVNASSWSAYVQSLRSVSRWQERVWPFAALAAGALASGEAFKIAMHKLRSCARAPANFDKLFALDVDVRFDLAPSDALRIQDLGSFDCVSGGAIVHAALFCLARIPHVAGTARIIEDTSSDYSNLNRYALLRRSQVFSRKAGTLLGIDMGNLHLHAEGVRYDERSADQLAPLADRVLVGVDHIPTRWLVQVMQPSWLGVGATTHWNAMTSFHERQLACARCLHPRDDATHALIPTVAFVSFWSGLLLATQFVRSAAGEQLPLREQHVFLTPLRPETAWLGPVAVHPDCPVCWPIRGLRVA